jgi:hypothetical protein
MGAVHPQAKARITAIEATAKLFINDVSTKNWNLPSGRIWQNENGLSSLTLASLLM